MVDYIEINEITFEVVKSKHKASLTSGHADLYSFYDRPSRTKIDVYEAWKDWFLECLDMGIECDNFHVNGANCMQFSLAFNIFYEGVQYVAWITRDHNRLYIVG